MKQYPYVINTKDIEYDILVNPSGICFEFLLYKNRPVGPKITRIEGEVYKGCYNRKDGIRFYI